MIKDDIKVILTRTYDPGNVGSVLRAMKNFDFTNIVSVNQINFDLEETLKMSAGAKDHYEHLRTSVNLKEETGKCNIVYAFTARKRKFYDIIKPEKMAEEIAALSDGTKVGLLFGNETNGLNNDETDLADKIVMIPTSPNYSSLNLASAVMISLYETHKYLLSSRKNEMQYEKSIPLKLKEQLYQSVEDIIVKDIIPTTKHAKQFKNNIRFIFKKMHLNEKEAGFILKMFKIIKRKIKK